MASTPEDEPTAKRPDPSKQRVGYWLCVLAYIALRILPIVLGSDDPAAQIAFDLGASIAQQIGMRLNPPKED